MRVGFYFILNDNIIDRFQNQKYWYASRSSPDDVIDFNSIPLGVPSKYLYSSDCIIAVEPDKEPFYIKNRAGTFNVPVTEDMNYIKLASQSIFG